MIKDFDESFRPKNKPRSGHGQGNTKVFFYDNSYNIIKVDENIEIYTLDMYPTNILRYLAIVPLILKYSTK